MYIVESIRGVLQGDPIATAAFTAAFCDVLNQVRRKYSDVVILGIADDTYFIGALLRVLEAFALAAELAWDLLGLRFRPDKSIAFARDRSQLQQVHREALVDAGVPLGDGLEVVGVPLGTAAFISSQLDKAVAGVRAKADALVQTHEAGPNTGQALFTTICLGLTSMVTHLFRSLPPEAVAAHARQVDTMVDCARRVLDLQHIDLDSAAGIEFRTRISLASADGGLGLASCARTVDAAYVSHWALVGPTVQKMLPHVPLTETATMALPPLAALQAAALRVGAAVEESGIKRIVSDLPEMLSNSQRGLQGVIGKHLGELAQKRFLASMPTATEAEQARKRAFVSGASTEAGAGIHVSRRANLNRLTDDEHRVTCAMRLGVDAFPAPLVAFTCPDCHQPVTDSTAHPVSCASSEAQSQRTRLHTAMDVASRSLVQELDPECVVTSSGDAYPADHGMRVSEACPEARNHRADAYVFDYGTGTGHLIDFTFTNAAKSTGQNGAAPGSHADAEEIRKYAQYNREFPDFSADSSPALVIVAMERHGSWSKGTKAYWKARVHAANERQKSREFPVPLSVLTRRVLQTLAVALRRVNASRILQFRRRAINAQRGEEAAEELAGV